MIFLFQQIFGPGEKNLPKNYHKYTTNNHPAPSQYHPPPGSKFPSRPSQCKLRDGSGKKKNLIYV